jgi:hypothetical protein
LKVARSERDSARALLREALEYTHHLPPCPLSDDTDGPCTCGRDGLLRRAEAEATEKSEQRMNLQQALAVLAREKHNGHVRWDGTCPPSNPAWRTEFEVIAIAEAYERAREPDPCAALRARLDSVEQERDRLRKVLRDLLPFADEKSNAYAWAKAMLDAAALGAAGERSAG